MADIVDFVQVYIKDSDILEKETDKISQLLENNIKTEAPYDKGKLRESIRVVSEVGENSAVVIGTWDEGIAPHGIFVLTGSRAVEGKPMKMPWGYRMSRRAIPPNDFLGRGLEATLEAYK